MDASTKEIEELHTLKPKQCVGFRHVQVLLLFLAMLLSYAMRVNMSMAIVAMTDDNDPNSLDWDVQSKSVVLSSFYWGYVMLQMVGGQVAARVGGQWPVLMLVSVNGLISFVIPVAAQYGGWQAVCACRVLQGLSQGFLFPSSHHLLGKWVPVEEKNRLITFVYAGCQLGNAFQLIISGFIADQWGWPAIFYTNGILSAAWAMFYVVLGADSPQTSRFIGKEEKLYIQTSLDQVGGHKKLPVPWKSILTSVPFWALLIAHCGQNWGLSTLMTLLPSYISNVLSVDIKSNGVMSALPYLVMYLASFPLGNLSDLALRRKWLSVTATRKICNSIGSWGPAVFLVLLSYAPAGDVPLAVAALTVVIGLSAGHLSGYMLVHIDMSMNFAGTLMGITNTAANIVSLVAPLAAGLMLQDELVHIDMSMNFAGTLMGITNTAANIVSLVAPLAAGLMLQDETSPGDWRLVFLTAAGVNFITNLVFVSLGSSARQPWDQHAGDSTEDVKQEIQEGLERGNSR